MTHHNPQCIETMLEKESKGEFLTLEQMDAGYQLEPFEYYVPYLYMRPDASDGLRSVFHNFVFISASEKRIREIVSSKWNTQTRYRLYHYCNRSGEEIMISDKEYQQLRDLIYNSQLKVFFGVPVTPLREMKVGNQVLLQVKNWENHPGIIERIKLKKNKVCIRVSFNFLGKTKSVSFDDLHDGDVTFADKVTEQLISGDLIRNFENEVSLLLGHCFSNRSAEKAHQDTSNLRRLYSFADIQIEDEDDCKRFTSLMLICAALLNEKDAIIRYTTQLQQWLYGKDMERGSKFFILNSSLFTITEAYMMIALFVSTRDPRLRDAAKAFRKDNPDCPKILGTFINKVRDIPTIKPTA